MITIKHFKMVYFDEMECPFRSGQYSTPFLMCSSQRQVNSAPHAGHTSIRQHALECDRCQQWTHRLCGTGISYTKYRGIMENMRYGATFPWTCSTCTTEAASNDEALILHSTRIDAATQ